MIKTALLTLETLEAPGLRFGCAVDNARFTLDSGPDVASPSPVQALLCAAGACTAMDVITILRKKRMAVSGYDIALEGVRRDQHPRGFTAITMVHRLRGRGLNATLLSQDKYCSVVASLRPTVTVTSRFEILPDGTETQGTP